MRPRNVLSGNACRAPQHSGDAHHALTGTRRRRRQQLPAANGPRQAPALSSTCAAIGSSVRDQRSEAAACPRRFRDRRPPAPERVDDGPPRAAGKDHEARTHTAACTTGPVSHTDRNQRAAPLITSFLAISAPVPSSVRHLLR
jgi:hypothetical protein